MAARRTRQSFSLDNGARIPIDSTYAYTVTSDGIVTPSDSQPFGACTVRDLANSLSPADRGLSEQGIQMVRLAGRLVYFPANCLKTVVNLNGNLIAYVDEQAIIDSGPETADVQPETSAVSPVLVAKLLAVALAACLMVAIAVVAFSASSPRAD